MPKFRVALTKDERIELERTASTGKAPARRLTHARVLLLADGSDNGPERTDDEIVDALGCSLRTVERVRKRFVTESLESSLTPRPQPSRPDKIKIRGNVEQRLIELACSDPPEGRCHWTLRLLGDEMVALGLIQRISTETVRQALKKTISVLGQSLRGAFRPTRTASLCGGWRM
jgi:hypothetical protein